MAYLYNIGLIIVGNKDKSIITPPETSPTEGSWRRRVEGTGADSILVWEKYVSGIWVFKNSLE